MNARNAAKAAASNAASAVAGAVAVDAVSAANVVAANVVKAAVAKAASSANRVNLATAVSTPAAAKDNNNKVRATPNSPPRRSRHARPVNLARPRGARAA